MIKQHKKHVNKVVSVINFNVKGLILIHLDGLFFHSWKQSCSLNPGTAMQVLPWSSQLLSKLHGVSKPQ